MFIQKPVVDQWYRHLDKGESFRVVAIDEDARTVELQNFDGDVEEVDVENWYSMSVEPIEAPEDWTGPMDDVDADDLGYSDIGTEEEGRSQLTPDELARQATKREAPELPGTEPENP